MRLIQPWGHFYVALQALDKQLQLFITEYSPYVRMVRILVREKKLQAHVEEVPARTRIRNSPYYDVNVAGRVPFLRSSKGVEVQGSRLILEYLDQHDGCPILESANEANYWEYSRLEESAVVVMDSISVWSRELKRPVDDRSKTVIEHETARSRRLAEKWESDIDSPIMRGPLNYPQLTLACALCMDQWNPYFEWRNAQPKLEAWLKPLETRPSFAETEPPSKISIN